MTASSSSAGLAYEVDGNVYYDVSEFPATASSPASGWSR